MKILKMKIVHLTLPLLSLIGTHTLYQGEDGFLKNCGSHECEILQGIRDIFECLRNVKVVCMVFTWLP